MNSSSSAPYRRTHASSAARIVPEETSEASRSNRRLRRASDAFDVASAPTRRHAKYASRSFGYRGFARTAARMAPRSSSRTGAAGGGRAAAAGGGTPPVGRPGWTDSSTDHLGTQGANPARSAAPSGHPARLLVAKLKAPGGNDDLGDDSIPPGDVGGALDAGVAVGSLSRSSMVAMKVRSSGPRDGRGPAMSASMSGRANAKPSPSMSSPSSSSANGVRGRAT